MLAPSRLLLAAPGGPDVQEISVALPPAHDFDQQVFYSPIGCSGGCSNPEAVARVLITQRIKCFSNFACEASASEESTALKVE